MTVISRSSLFEKLDSFLYSTIEGSTTFCKIRMNPYVELVHWVHQILQNSACDFSYIVKHFEINESSLASDVVSRLDKLSSGYESVVDFSSDIDLAIERSWLLSSIKYKEAKIRSARLLEAIMMDEQLVESFYRISPELRKIKLSYLTGKKLEDLLANSSEKTSVSLDVSSSAAEVSSKDEALSRFTVDLTHKARSGEIDPVVGRDHEVDQIIDVLLRRRQNNPLLAGEAGVGKTAVVEGFAVRVAQGDVPQALRDVSVLLLDIGLLKAGASMRGEFEQRLKKLIHEVQQSDHPIILFIDEIHTLVGAGGEAGTGDAANLLKPALARGNLKTIGATTWAEYKKYIEKDPALTRRFQLIKVQEPSEQDAIAMLNALVPSLEQHHGVDIHYRAVEAAVKLSSKYIADRQLPDKAISLLDTACARVAITQTASPAILSAALRQQEMLGEERVLLEREGKLGNDVGERLTAVYDELQAIEIRIQQLNQQWKSEADAFASVSVTKKHLLGEESTGINTPECQKKYQDTLLSLRKLQGDEPLISVAVSEDDVARVVQSWTGVPVGRMLESEVMAVLGMEGPLMARVIGQDHAISALSRKIQTSNAGLDDPDKPIGVFLLAGPSGVGKTETAIALAESIYGGQQALITINMSEFQEAHTVSSLKGAPPGYVGYGEGGVLTEAVRRKPYSVILLDEVEKAHPDVHEIFFQVFDKGWMEDGEGRRIDFRNTIILLTSNVGSELIINQVAESDSALDMDILSDLVREELLQVFPPAFLGRLSTIPYLPLCSERLRQITKLQLQRVVDRAMENHRIELTYSPSVIDFIVSKCTNANYGGRQIHSVLENLVLPELGIRVLESLGKEHKLSALKIRVLKGELKFEEEIKS